MSKKIKSPKLRDFEDTYMTLRKEWTVKPVTKVISNKKRDIINKGYKEEY